MTVNFGTELSCVDDIAEDGRVVTGNLVVGEALARRLTTPRGRLIGDPNYGYDLTQYLNDDMSPRDIAAMRAGIVAECLKDERVTAADVTTVLSKAGALTISILVTTGAGPFTLVLAVSATSTQVLSV